MRISNNTIRECASKGINVRWFPELTYDEYAKRMYDEDIKRYCDYYKNHVGDNCTGNKLFDTQEELEASAKEKANIKAQHGYSSYDYTTLYITYNGRTFAKKENVKSKEITTEYVLKLVEKNEKAYNGTYGRFALAMQKILETNGYKHDFFIYPTTYGIGIWVFYNFRADEHRKRVENIMKSRGIEYYNEYSEAGYVFRFKVSKNAANLEKINKQI